MITLLKHVFNVFKEIVAMRQYFEVIIKAVSLFPLFIFPRKKNYRFFSAKICV